MHTEPLTDLDRSLLRERAQLRNRLFFWIGLITGVGLLLFTARMVLPPLIEGYEFRDLDLVAEVWIFAATMLAISYLLIGLFERKAMSGVRQDVRDRIKEVWTGKVVCIDEKTEPEPTELRLIESASAGHCSVYLRTIRELNLLTTTIRAHAKAGGALRVEIAPHSKVVLRLTAVEG